MKIILAVNIWDALRGGGATSSVKHILEELERRKLQTVVMTTSRNSRIQVSQHKSTRFYFLPPRNLYWIGDKDEQRITRKIVWQLIDIWNPIMFANLWKILKEEQPDVLHIHKMRGFSTSIWSAARHAGITNIVQTCQDYEILSPEGTLTSYIGQCSSEGRWFMQPYIRIRARLSDVIRVATCPSRYTLNKLASHGFFSKSQQKIIRNSHGLDLININKMRDEILSQKNRLLSKKINLLFIGRLEKNKGIRELCHIFASHCKNWPNFHLHIAGDGSLRPELERLFANHHQITFHGWVDGEKKQKLLLQSHIMAVPSMYEEISPVVISEAYAYGMPVLGSRIGGIPELIEEKETGWCYDPNDVLSIVHILNKLSLHPYQLQDLFEKCLTKSAEFTPEKISSHYVETYLIS